jgi:transcriptional regulator with XRE-family HTH domain
VDLNGVNRRIAYWRTRRRLTQHDFAVLMGRSRSWVQKLESGDRQLDPRLSVLERACAVLQVPLEALVSDEATGTAECVDAAEIAALRVALQRYDVLSGFFDTTGPDPAEELAVVGRQVTWGWDSFQASHYSALGRLLPDVIVAAARTIAATTGAERPAAFAQASLAYQLACAVLMKFADPSVGLHAADRAVIAAERSGDELIIGAAARQLAHALLASGQHQAAADLATAAAQRLADRLLAAGVQGLSIYGMLFLKAAVATAGLGDASTTGALLAEAATTADRMGIDANALWTGYGPTNCLLHRVSTQVQLSDGAAALAAVDAIDPVALAALPRERQAAHLLDVAHAQTLTGCRDNAAATLLRAERLAAQEVHSRPYARTVIADLVRMAVPGPSFELRSLAQRAGALP